MRALVTGSHGQLGRALRQRLEEGAAPDEWRGAQVDWVDIDELDIADHQAVDAWFDACEAPYDVVFNCAAMTNVDGCESNFAAAFAANALGPLYLARACARTGATLVHVSTDYVFPGNDPSPRAEDDVPAPISAYGRSKLAGEGLALAANPRTHVVRTAWLYGEGKNFVATMLRIAATHGSVTVVDDQYGNPTSAWDLAGELLRIAVCDAYGIWHGTNEGTCSWADLAEQAFALAGVACTVKRCTSQDWKTINPQAADRPHYSSLENARLKATIGNTMRPWKEALADYIKQRERQEA